MCAWCHDFMMLPWEEGCTFFFFLRVEEGMGRVCCCGDAFLLCLVPRRGLWRPSSQMTTASVTNLYGRVRSCSTLCSTRKDDCGMGRRDVVRARRWCESVWMWYVHMTRAIRGPPPSLLSPSLPPSPSQASVRDSSGEIHEVLREP